MVLLLLAHLGRAQDCGCADSGNCPLQFTPGESTQVCYEFTDAFNNDLASPTQGVCGVYIKFRHGRIGSLDLTLTSPAGQQVQLVGTSGNCNTFTPLATWDILFVPCATACQPDTINNCPYPCVFDGCPTTCPWGSGTYDGQYHPFSGCLESFNAGPMNGQWCIEIENDAQFNGGTILEFEIIPCDDSGQFCCDADAGNLPDPNVTACINDPSLDLDLVPTYGAIVPDPLEYGYTFAVFNGNNLYALTTNDNFTSYPAGSFTVCGLSYLLADAANLPAPGSPLTPQSLDANLNGPSPAFCGDIGLNCVVVNIGAPPPTTLLRDTICDGETVVFDGQNIGTTGLYRDTVPSFFGCDSIINLELMVMLDATTNLVETVCFGETYTVGTTTYAASGIYTQPLLTQFGCDSTVTLNLTVLPENTVTLNEIICQGESFAVGNNSYNTSGTYINTLQTQPLNCDSTVTLNLTVVQTSVSIATPGILTCQQTSVPLVSTASTSFGTLTYLWTTNGGAFGGATDQANTTATAPGTYTLTVTSAGCSSSATVTVQQDAMMPNATIVPSATALTCDTLSISLNGSGSTPAGNISYAWRGTAWNPLGTSQSISTTQPGTFRLIITDLTNQCKDTATVVITQDIVPPTASGGADMELSCTMPTASLNGTASSPSGNISYNWSTLDGNILPPANALTALADEPGTYQLIVENLANGCRDTDLVIVTVDTLTPSADIALPQGNTLNCYNDTLTLDGSGSTGSQFVVYQWLGNVFNQQGTPPTGQVNSPGNYSLVLFDTSNGCRDTATVSIGSDFVFPNADAGPDDSLTCSINSLLIGGSGSSSGPDFIYEWTSSPSGAFLSSQNLPTVNVNAAAIYNLTVTDTTNGCTDSDFMVVEYSETPPVANAGPDYLLNCTDTAVILDASNSTIVPFAEIAWINSAGDTISDDVQVTVDYAGVFVLSIRLAFCTSYDTVVVTQGTVAPIADAGPDVMIDCLTGQATLDGSGSDSGFNFTLEWTALSGQIFSGETTTTPIVDDPGEYQLQVTNIQNGCVSYDTVLATVDLTNCVPQVNAGADGLINCYDLTLTDTLTATGSVGANITYNWTALSGTIFEQTEPFAPIVSAGTFVFTVTNTTVGLSAMDTVIVLEDTAYPVAEAGTNILSLTCPELAVCYPLDATGTSVGPQFSYTWEGPEPGSICTDPNQLNVEVLGEGLYTLSVLNTDNGCKSDDGVLLRLLDFEPIADAGLDSQMICGDTAIVLDGTGSSASGLAYTYTWSSVGGNILANGQTTTPTVQPNNGSDVFTLVVENTLNLCRDTDEVVIFAPVNCSPDCIASASGPFDCNDPTVDLFSNGSSAGADISYLWETINGSFCGDITMANTCADAAGIYNLTVTRTYPNGAIFTSSCQVQVANNGQPPATDAGPDANITCENQTLTIGGNATASGSGISYSWTTSGGSFCGSTNTKTVCVDEPGLYSLLVVNSLTGCSATDEVLIGLDTIHPTANAGVDAEITCNSNTVVLTGTGNPSNVDYTWTTINGDICAGANTPSPVACDAGTYILTVTTPENGCSDSDIVNVSASPDVPNPDAGPDLYFTCSDTVFTINATATGQNPLNYNWTASNGGCIIGAADQLQVTVGCIGTYTLMAQDAVTGCTAVSAFDVLADNFPPDVQLGNPAEINCQNLSVMLDASASLPAGQLSFAWTTGNGHFVSGQNTATPTVDSAGLYTVTVTNTQTHCTATASVTVSRDASIPTAIAGFDTTLTCVRNSLVLSGLGSSVGVDITYLWTTSDGHIVNDESSMTPLVDEPGTYTLEVRNLGNGCVVTDIVTVSMDTLQPTAAIDASQPLTITCEREQVVLLGNLSSPFDTLDFAWTTTDGAIFAGANGPNATVTAAGTYLLTITNERNGCTDTVSVVVDEDLVPPTLSFGAAPQLTCERLTVQLSVQPATADFGYDWAGPGTIVGSDTPTPTVSQTGVYSVTVTDWANGCTTEGSVVVTQNKQPPQAIATTQGNIDCDNLTATITGLGSSDAGVAYTWSTLDGGNIAHADSVSTTVDAAGTYILIVKRLDNGCADTSSTVVIATSTPISNALLRLEHPNCLDPDGYIYIDSVIGGASPYYFALDGHLFITYPQFSYLDEGEHILTIKDENGCSWTDTLTLVNSEEVLVELGPDITLIQGESTTLEAQISIEPTEVDTIWWTNLPLPVECPECLTQTVTPEETTTYRIHVVDTNGCAAMDKITITVEEERPFYVPTAFSPNGDGTNDRLFLYAGPEVKMIRSFRIFDRWGDLVFFADDFDPNTPQFGWDGRLDGQPMDPAVFVWKVALEYQNGKVREFYGDLTLVR